VSDHGIKIRGVMSKLSQQMCAELQIADLVGTADIIHFSDLSTVQDGVEGVCRVAGKEVAPGVFAVAVEL
jgi:hypothetical protein